MFVYAPKYSGLLGTPRRTGDIAKELSFIFMMAEDQVCFLQAEMSTHLHKFISHIYIDRDVEKLEVAWYILGMVPLTWVHRCTS